MRPIRAQTLRLLSTQYVAGFKFLEVKVLCLLSSLYRFTMGFLFSGVMKLSDLSQIFRSEKFPANLMKQYINLLSKFEVALPWSAEFLLVPSLLPDSQQDSNQPLAAGVSPVVAQAMNMCAYTKGRVLRRQYVMSYVPSGFWPRLITRY